MRVRDGSRAYSRCKASRTANELAPTIGLNCLAHARNQRTSEVGGVNIHYCRMSTGAGPGTAFTKSVSGTFPAGIEPATDRLKIDCSTQLSYGVVVNKGLEPLTSGLCNLCSTAELDHRCIHYFSHRGIRPSDFQDRRTREDSRASPADNAFRKEFFLIRDFARIEFVEHGKQCMVGAVGVEPTAFGLRVRYSAC